MQRAGMIRFFFDDHRCNECLTVGLVRSKQTVLSGGLTGSERARVVTYRQTSGENMNARAPLAWAAPLVLPLPPQLPRPHPESQRPYERAAPSTAPSQQLTYLPTMSA